MLQVWSKYMAQSEIYSYLNCIVLIREIRSYGFLVFEF